MSSHREVEEEKRRFRSDLRDLGIIAFVFLGFAAIAIVVIPKLPPPFSTIAYFVGLIAVGTFLASLAKKT